MMSRRRTRAPESVTLPTPARQGRATLEQVLASRRSVRSFAERPLAEGELGQLLWAAQGITDDEGDRTAPSAGALFPLETYVASAEGVFHYAPRRHRLRRIDGEDRRHQLFRAALEQDPVLKAPVTIVLAAVYRRTARKYGERRSPRYVHMEVGHAAQNLLLQAVALGLGAVVIGAFEDDEVSAALSLPADQRPLYLIPVGEPRG